MTCTYNTLFCCCPTYTCIALYRKGMITYYISRKFSKKPVILTRVYFLIPFYVLFVTRISTVQYRKDVHRSICNISYVTTITTQRTGMASNICVFVYVTIPIRLQDTGKVHRYSAVRLSIIIQCF